MPATPGEGLVVGARIRAQPISTGVHHRADSVLDVLAADGVTVDEVHPERGSGPAGHAWEQAVLPGDYRSRHNQLPQPVPVQLGAPWRCAAWPPSFTT